MRNRSVDFHLSEAWGKCFADVYSCISDNVTTCGAGTIIGEAKVRGGSKTDLATAAGLKIHVADNAGSVGLQNAGMCGTAGRAVIRFKFL